MILKSGLSMAGRNGATRSGPRRVVSAARHLRAVSLASCLGKVRSSASLATLFTRPCRLRPR